MSSPANETPSMGLPQPQSRLERLLNRARGLKPVGFFATSLLCSTGSNISSPPKHELAPDGECDFLAASGNPRDGYRDSKRMRERGRERRRRTFEPTKKVHRAVVPRPRPEKPVKPAFDLVSNPMMAMALINGMGKKETKQDTKVDDSALRQQVAELAKNQSNSETSLKTVANDVTSMKVQMAKSVKEVSKATLDDRSLGSVKTEGAAVAQVSSLADKKARSPARAQADGQVTFKGGEQSVKAGGLDASQSILAQLQEVRENQKLSAEKLGDLEKKLDPIEKVATKSDVTTLGDSINATLLTQTTNIDGAVKKVDGLHTGLQEGVEQLVDLYQHGFRDGLTKAELLAEYGLVVGPHRRVENGLIVRLTPQDLKEGVGLALIDRAYFNHRNALWLNHSIEYDTLSAEQKNAVNLHFGRFVPDTQQVLHGLEKRVAAGVTRWDGQEGQNGDVVCPEPATIMKFDFEIGSFIPKK